MDVLLIPSTLASTARTPKDGATSGRCTGVRPAEVTWWVAPRTASVSRTRVYSLALGLIAGCGGAEAGAQDSALDTDEEGGNSGPEDASSSEGTSGLVTGGLTDGGPMCPEPEPLDTVDGLVHLARADGASFIEILDLEARGALVYGCTGTQGLTVWDVSEDTGDLVVERVGPPELAHETFPRCQHVALDATGDRAVITNRGDEVQPTPWLHVFDVRDPAQPQPLRGWSGDASIEGAVWDGDRIYAAAHTAGVLVFEDTGGAALEQRGAFGDALSDAWLPLVRDGVLYVAEGNTGLRIYDVSADNPVLLSTLQLGGSSRDLALEGDTLYVAASSSVVAVNIADPAAPTILAESPTTGTSVAIALGRDGLLYSAEWDEVRAYDTLAAGLPRVWSEVVPTSDDFSRVLTVSAHADRDRVFAGEWTGMHMFESRTGATAPEIVAEPTSVQFGRVEAGDAQDRVVLIRNEGDQPLTVSGFESDWNTFSIDDGCFTVEPGGVHALELRFSPITDDVNTGLLRLTTDDPDEPEYAIHYTGNAAGADVGDPMPDFMLQDLEGNDWSRADLDGKVVLLAYFATF